MMRRVDIVLVATATAVLVGLAGTVIRPLPGAPLIWTAVLVWASVDNSVRAWLSLGAATLIAIAGYMIRQLLAGLRVAQIVAPARSLAIGAAAAVVGYLLARMLGLVAGFAAGLYVAEQRRLRRYPAIATQPEPRQWLSREAAVEVGTGLLMAGSWLMAVAG